jgi:hypothetical protein
MCVARLIAAHYCVSRRAALETTLRAYQIPEIWSLALRSLARLRVLGGYLPYL